MQNSAYLKAAAYDRLDQRHQQLTLTLTGLYKRLDDLREAKRKTQEDFKTSIEQTKKAHQAERKAWEEKLCTHATIIQKREGQIAELRENLNTHVATLAKRDEQIGERQKHVGQL